MCQGRSVDPDTWRIKCQNEYMPTRWTTYRHWVKNGCIWVMWNQMYLPIPSSNLFMSVGSKRSTTYPVRSMRNLVKSHFTSLLSL